MIQGKEDRANYLGITVFIVFFFLFISAFSDQSINRTKATSRCELITELHLDPVNAIPINIVQLPSFQKSWVSFLDKLNIRLFNEDFKISSFNNKISIKNILLQKTQLSIKPIFICRFYYHLSSTDTEELPVLS
jgi:hypothetical protein